MTGTKFIMCEKEVLARTLYGEARGEYARLDGGLSALIGVANVIINRAKRKSWFGKSVSEVCLKPYQFSCWNQADPNRPLLLNVSKDSDPLYATCLEVAEGALSGKWPDLTKDSDHYYAVWMQRAPAWSLGAKPRVKLGQHLFFRVNPSTNQGA